MNTAEYDTLTALVSIVVIVSLALFLAFVMFEVFRSIRYAKLHEKSRTAEADRVERELLAAARKRREAALANLKRMQDNLR